jgi:hypothetical protein
MRGVEGKLALIAAVPVVFDRAEDGALRHRAAVHVHGYGGVFAARIADRVVFVRRDQAAGGPGPTFIVPRDSKR